MSRAGYLLCGVAALATVSPVSAQVDVNFSLVAVATPTASDTLTTLPVSIASVCHGDTYFVELWVSDVGEISTGLSSVYVNLVWPGMRAAVVSISHGTIYTSFQSGTIVFGSIVELGGSAITSQGVAIEPEWVRVAVIEMTDEANRAITFRLEPGEVGVAALGRGVIAWDDILLGEVTIAGPSVGDLNCDGGVDLVDHAILERCLGGPGVSAPPNGCNQAEFHASDLDLDDDVDLDDFNRLQLFFDG